MIWVAALLSALGGGEECRSLLEQGRARYEAKVYDQAVAAFELALRTCEDQQAARLNLARAQLMAQRFPEVKKTLAGVRTAEALKLVADAHYLLGEDRAAEAALGEAVRLDPAYVEAHYALGRVFYQQNRFEAAAAQFRKVLEREPRNYRAYDNLALALEGLNQTEAALTNYRKALELVHKDHPQYDWAHANLANFLIKLGDDRQAFQFAAEAAHRNPNSARNFFLGGKALAKLGHNELAVKWLRRAVELDANYPEPRYLLGQTLRKLGQSQEAQRELRAFQELQARTPRDRR